MTPDRRSLVFACFCLALGLLACGPASTLTPTALPTLAFSPGPVVIIIPSFTPTATSIAVASMTPSATRAAPTEELDPTPEATQTLAPVLTATPLPSVTAAPEASELTEAPTATPTPTPIEPEPAPTADVTPTPIAILPNQPLIEPEAVRVYVDSISIPTYDYQGALLPTGPDDPVYPYARLDWERVGGKFPRTFSAVILENAYARVTILPELGGRVYAWVDKTTGKNVAYSNPVIKPTDWGYRGWWLATGGIEWCLPTEEHGLNEYRPWQYALGRDSVEVSDHEDRTGLDVQVTISLDQAHNYLILQPRLTNNTTSRQAFKFWINAMLAFSDNRVSDATRLILPVERVMVHSTGDSGLPGGGSTIEWPSYGGRDLSVIGNLEGWLGVFAAPSASAGFAGAYDPEADLGVVRAFPASAAAGVKFFSGRGLDTSRWTDDGSTYFELWGGIRPTFWDEAVLEPGQTLDWTERWYAVSGLGDGYDYANAQAALLLRDLGLVVRAGAASSFNLVGARLKLWQAGQPVAEWIVSLGPGRPVSAVWQRPPLSCSGEACARLGLQLFDRADNLIAQTGVTNP